MTQGTVWERYSGLLSVQISGVERAAELADQGRTQDARDHLISSARAVWQNRWLSRRTYSLRRLGEALDTQRFPQLEPIATALAREEPGSPGRFLDYLRHRATPDLAPFVQAPAAPGPDFKPQDQHSLELWTAWAATGDAQTKACLDRRISEYLDPHVVISWHETAYRWARLVASALTHGRLDDRSLCHLILFGLDLAEQCNDTCHLSEPAQTSVGGNHLFFWIWGWLQFVVLFPEFRRTPALRSGVVARLDDEVSKQVMPDGSMIEGCPGYQNCCLYVASELLRLGEHYQVAFPPAVHEAFARMLWHTIGLQRPDFRVPFLGDSHDQHTPGYITQMRRFYSFPELDWVITEGKAGRAPGFTSRAYPSIGYYVLRNGWNRDSVYLCFDGGRFGQSHHHEDMLHFELYAYGRSFLVDVGDHSYTDHWMRQWAVTSQAHNTVLIDGLGQCRWRQDRDLWYSPVPLENPWRSDAAWDVVSAVFAGPFEKDLGATRVRRRVAFHKGTPAFFWVTDWVAGQGRHEVTELFHFAHDIPEVEEITAGVRTRLPGGPDLAILVVNSKDDPAKPHAGAPGPNPQSPIPPASPTTSILRFRGQQGPTRGWVAPKLYTTEPAWEVHVTGWAELPLRRDFVVLPWATALPDDVAATLELAAGQAVLRLRVAGREERIELPEGAGVP